MIPFLHLSYRIFPFSGVAQLKKSILTAGFLLLCMCWGGCREATPDIPAQQQAAFWSDEVSDHPNRPERFGFGRPASPEQIAVWDIDVRPDGTGLPPGSGTARFGALLYARQCAACHGPTGTEGPEDRLVGRPADHAFPFGEDLESWEAKTIGGYWPYATTLYDYINRAMPLQAPGSLTADEVYALSAFLLHRNQLIADTTVMNAHTLPLVKMPAHDRFVVDDRLNYQEVR
jgi:S-disulfanyl-L-cysteine oxidoreductase SoxD